MRKLVLALIAASLAATPVEAQDETEREREVTVRLDNLIGEIAADLDLPEALLPDEIDVPEGVAAEACGAEPGAIAMEPGSARPACLAVTGSPELTRFVQEGMVVSGGSVDGAVAEEEPDPAPLGRDPDLPEDAVEDEGDTARDGLDDPAGTATVPRPPAAVGGKP